MNNDYFMGNTMPYQGGYTPSYLSTMGMQRTPQPNPNSNNTNIVWTMGFESAKAYPLLPGKTLMLMDSESPRFYVKTVDTNGYATIKAYSFHEEKPSTAPTNAPNFVTQEQLEAAIMSLKEQLAPKDSQPVKAPVAAETKPQPQAKNLL